MGFLSEISARSSAEGVPSRIRLPAAGSRGLSPENGNTSEPPYPPLSVDYRRSSVDCRSIRHRRRVDGDHRSGRNEATPRLRERTQTVRAKPATSPSIRSNVYGCASADHQALVINPSMPRDLRVANC